MAEPNVVGELAEGWSEFTSRTWLWTVVVAAAIGNMVWLGGTQVLGPLVAKQSLGGAAAWGVIVACQGVGLLVGGLLMLRVRPRRPLLFGMAMFIPAALPLVFLASVRSTAVIATGYLINGIALEIFNVAWATALQQNVPLEILSRVSAYDMIGSLVFAPVGLAVAGPTADALGLRETLWLGAALATASTLAGLAVRDVRELRATDTG